MMIDPAVLSFTVPGKPAAQGSKKLLGRVMVESCKALPGWRSDVRTAAMAVRPYQWAKDPWMRVSFVAFFPRPKNHTVAGKGLVLKANAPAFPGRVGDTDKLARALLDSLTGVIWRDDDQVVHLYGQKLYAALGEEARMEVIVEALG